jgi:hypothetical protein
MQKKMALLWSKSLTRIMQLVLWRLAITRDAEINSA